jgi:hypothetical protein
MPAIPADAPRSEDGRYWWDGKDWQLIEGQGEGAVAYGTRSPDGHYWWDGAGWQLVEGHGETSALDPNQPMDWTQFPELARTIQYGGDVDAYLTDLGIDPHLISSDPVG